MTSVEKVLFTAVVGLAVTGVLWPALIILGDYTDDADNWASVFYLSVCVLLWVFVL